MNPRYRRMLDGLKGKSHGPSEPPWFLYIVECNDGSLYTGITNDIIKRIRKHNEGKGARYTRTHRPVTLVYYETCENRSAALIREAEIKSWPTHKKRDLAL